MKDKIFQIFLLIIVIFVGLWYFSSKANEPRLITEVTSCKITCSEQMKKYSNEDIDRMVMAQSGDLMKCPNDNYCYMW